MAEQKERRTEKMARDIVKTYHATHNLQQLLKDVSEQSAVYGYYSSYNRELFINEVLRRIEQR